MRIHNVHERTVALAPAQAGALLDSLGSPGDRLWPVSRWPPMRLDPGLSVGAHGGHASIRYDVVAHEPGRQARFRFRGMDGEHAFEVHPAGERASVLRHVIIGEVHGRMALLWRLVIEPLHDAVLEDAFDRAEGRPPRPLPLRVRLLRGVARRLL